MGQNERLPEVEVQKHAEAVTPSASGGIVNEVTGQLKNYSDGQKAIENSAIGKISDNFTISYSFGPEDREKALGKAGEELTRMVQGDLPHLKEQLAKNGLSTAEVDAKIAKNNEKVEAVKPFQQALLKGDSAALQKMLGEMTPEQVKEAVDLVQNQMKRHGLVLDYTDGKLIVSRTTGDRGVLISKDKTDVIGINDDGSYDFSKQYRGENAGKELAAMGDSALQDFAWGNKIESRSGSGVIRPLQNMMHENRTPRTK